MLLEDLQLLVQYKCELQQLVYV